MNLRNGNNPYIYQQVIIAVDVDDASVSVFDEIDDSRDEVVDRKSRNSADERSQVVQRLQAVSLDSPTLTKCAHQEPVEAPPRVQVTWSVQPVLALGRIYKVKVDYLELEPDATFTVSTTTSL